MPEPALSMFAISAALLSAAMAMIALLVAVLWERYKERVPYSVLPCVY